MSHLMKTKKSLTERFLEKVIKDQSGCWLWNGAHGGRGRPRMWNGKKAEYAARVSYELYKGNINNLYVCHTCDNGLCVNPDHLFLGTAADNSKDMANKNRSTKGSKNKHAKLNENDILDIKHRRLVLKQQVNYIAKHYNVERRTITRIIHNQTWI